MPAESTNDAHEISTEIVVLSLLADELSQQRTEYLARASGLNSRATILVSAASIVVALQSPDLNPHWTTIAACLGLLSATSALIVLWPRGRPNNSTLELESEILALDPASARRRLISRQADILKKKDHSLRIRGRIMAAGFAFFGGMVACTTLAIVLQT